MARGKKDAAAGKRKRSERTKKKTPGVADTDQEEESGIKRPAITKIDGSIEDVGNKVGTFF